MPDYDLSEIIEENASAPASASIGDRSIATKPLDQLIDADRYLAAKNATAQPHFGLRFTKLIPPGCG